MHDDLSTADTEQLERWAFGRQSTEADVTRAAAALGELARRAAAATALTAPTDEVIDRERDGETTPATSLESADNPEPESESAKRPRVNRTAFALAACIVLAAIIAAALLITAPRSVQALAVFDGERTTAEALLGDQLEGVGQRVGAGPSVLVDSDMSTVVAYLSNSRLSGPLDQVCLAVIEPQGVADWSCVARDEFVVSGVETLLYGLLGLYAIDWSAQGELIARMPGAFDVGPSGGGASRGDYRDGLFVEQSESAREVGRVLGALDITLGAGPIVVMPIADVGGAPADDLGVIAAWSAISPDPQEGVVVCLGIIDLPTPGSSEGAVRSAECVMDERMAEQGLRFETSFGTVTTVWLWNNELGLRGTSTDL